MKCVPLVVGHGNELDQLLVIMGTWHGFGVGRWDYMIYYEL